MRTGGQPKGGGWGKLWLPLLILIAGTYLFWVLPWQLGDAPVRVEFESIQP